MRWIKTACAGFTASLMMFIFLFAGIHVTDLAPFNVTPSSAFLYNLGIDGGPLPLLLHFIYGTFWSLVLMYVLEDEVTVGKAVLLALALWVFMMFVYSPLIGWGFFGFGYAHLLEIDHPLYLEQGPAYLFTTLFLHLVYGLVLGWLVSRWAIGDFAPASE